MFRNESWDLELTRLNDAEEFLESSQVLDFGFNGWSHKCSEPPGQDLGGKSNKCLTSFMPNRNSNFNKLIIAQYSIQFASSLMLMNI